MWLEWAYRIFRTIASTELASYLIQRLTIGVASFAQMPSALTGFEGENFCRLVKNTIFVKKTFADYSLVSIVDRKLAIIAHFSLVPSHRG